jgi:fatty acid desaturase
MEGTVPLTTVRWIAVAIYLCHLIAFQFAARMVKTQSPRDPEMLRLLLIMLVVVAVVDYGVSLWLERKQLAFARSSGGERGKAAVSSAAIVVAALGASLAVYGMVLAVLGAPVWGYALFVLCLVYGMHLMIRWSNYERAAEGEAYQP